MSADSDQNRTQPVPATRCNQARRAVALQVLTSYERNQFSKMSSFNQSISLSASLRIFASLRLYHAVNGLQNPGITTTAAQMLLHSPKDLSFSQFGLFI